MNSVVSATTEKKSLQVSGVMCGSMAPSRSRSSSLSSSSNKSRASTPKQLLQNQYSRDFLMNRRDLDQNKELPKCLNSKYLSNGVWNPELCWADRVLAADKSEPSSSLSHEVMAKGSRDPAVSRIQREEPTTCGEASDIVLSPQRRSFVGGCHVSQKSSTPSINEDLAILGGGGGRRIGSGRINCSLGGGGGGTNEFGHPYSGSGSRSNRFTTSLDSPRITSSSPFAAIHHPPPSATSSNRRPPPPQSMNGGGNAGRFHNSSSRMGNGNNMAGGGHQSYRNNHHHSHHSRNNHYEEEEPEWFSGGPTSQNDTIELVGFDSSSEDKSRRTLRNTTTPSSIRKSEPEIKKTVVEEAKQPVVEPCTANTGSNAPTCNPPVTTTLQPSQDTNFDFEAILSQDMPFPTVGNESSSQGSRFRQFFEATTKSDNSKSMSEAERRSDGVAPDLMRLLMNANISVDSHHLDNNAQEKLQAMSGKVTTLADLEANLQQRETVPQRHASSHESTIQQQQESIHLSNLLTNMCITSPQQRPLLPTKQPPQQTVPCPPQIVVYEQQQQQQQPQQTVPCRTFAPFPPLIQRRSPLPFMIGGPPLSPGAAAATLPPPPAPMRVPSPQELAVHTQGILQNALLKKLLEEQKQRSERQQQTANGLSSCEAVSATMASFVPTQVMRKIQAAAAVNNNNNTASSSDDTQQQRQPRPIVKTRSPVAPPINHTPDILHNSGIPNGILMQQQQQRMMYEQQQRFISPQQLQTQQAMFAAANLLQQQQQQCRPPNAHQQRLPTMVPLPGWQQQQGQHAMHAQAAAAAAAAAAVAAAATAGAGGGGGGSDMSRWFGSAVLEAAPPLPRLNALSVEELERQHNTAAVKN